MNADVEQCRITAYHIPNWGDDCCFELRALGVWDPKRDPEQKFRRNVSGYYDDPEAMARDAASLSGRAEGVYLIPNPAERAIICRSKNKITFGIRTALEDKNILRRRWLLVDFDPVRPPKISSTDAEQRAALERALEVREDFRNRGARGVVFASSGNGAHLLIPMDDPNTATARLKCERVLKNLAERFGDKKVLIGIETFNASRLIRYYGTMACKGSDCPEEGRPHRISCILEVDPTEDGDGKQ